MRSGRSTLKNNNYNGDEWHKVTQQDYTSTPTEARETTNRMVRIIGDWDGTNLGNATQNAIRLG